MFAEKHNHVVSDFGSRADLVKPYSHPKDQFLCNHRGVGAWHLFFGGRPFAWTALIARADPSGINKEGIMGTEIGDIMSRAEGCLQDDQKQ